MISTPNSPCVSRGELLYLAGAKDGLDADLVAEIIPPGRSHKEDSTQSFFFLV